MYTAKSVGKEDAKFNNLTIRPLVYLVDDDEDFREEMVLGLARLGLNVLGFDNAASLYRAYAVRPSDIVILDIGLVGENGLSIAAHLRSSKLVGIIIATARGNVEDRIHGLEAGADAYLVKPIGVGELAATVVTLYERLNKHRSALPSPDLEWALLESGWVLTDGMGHRLRLTTTEQRLLARLFVERGETIHRRALVEAIGEDVYEFNYNYLDTIVSRLRRRAKKAGMAPPLHAIRGIGFTFTE